MISVNSVRSTLPCCHFSVLSRRQARVHALPACSNSHKPGRGDAGRPTYWSSPSLTRETPLIARQFPARQSGCSRQQLGVAAVRGPQVSERVVASLPYLIPLLDGLRYSRFFLAQFPAFGRLLMPLGPLAQLYFSVPFSGMVVFFAVYVGIIKNNRFTRYVRYNALQAIMLDMILVLPGMLERLFRAPTSGPGLQVYVAGYTAIWLCIFFSVTYGVISCLSGKTARLPYIADAADAQVQ